LRAQPTSSFALLLLLFVGRAAAEHPCNAVLLLLAVGVVLVVLPLLLLFGFLLCIESMQEVLFWAGV
jgi:hypothetical protein